MDKSTLNETTRDALARTSADRGAEVEQIGGAQPGIYKTDGYDKWLFMGRYQDVPDGSGVKDLVAYASATLSGASTTIQVNVPSGARIKSCQLQVTTAITSGDGATSWDAAYATGSTQSICTGKAFTKNTKVNAFFDVNTDTDIASAETDIAITPDSNTFSGGVILAIVRYETLTTLADV